MGAPRSAFLILGLAAMGCGVIEGPVNQPRTLVVELQAWNRTLDPIFLIDAEGRRLDVPACGHAIAPRFTVNRVEVRTEAGFYFGTGTTGVGDPGRPQQMIITDTPGDSRDALDPTDLPPCEGHVTVAPPPA